MARTPPPTAYVPTGASRVRRIGARYTERLWSVRHAQVLEGFYDMFADMLLRLHWRKEPGPGDRMVLEALAHKAALTAKPDNE